MKKEDQIFSEENKRVMQKFLDEVELISNRLARYYMMDSLVSLSKLNKLFVKITQDNFVDSFAKFLKMKIVEFVLNNEDSSFEKINQYFTSHIDLFLHEYRIYLASELAIEEGNQEKRSDQLLSLVETLDSEDNEQ